MLMFDTVKSTIAVTLVLACFSSPRAAAQTSSADLSKFFAQYFEERLRDDPEFATTVGRHDYDDRWSDLSPQGRTQRRGHLQQTFDQLQKFGAQGLSEQDALSVRLLSYDLRTQLDALDLETHLLRVGQLYGSHTRVYLVIDRMPAFTVKDCENIIARLHAVPAHVDQNIVILNEAIASGVTQPKIVADLVTEQLKAQVAQDVSTTPLLEFLKKMPSSITEAERTRLRKQATDVFENDFRPAWRKYLEYMQTTYAAHVRPGIGIGSLKDGKDDYAILIRRLTTTNMPPEEIHKIGLAEVDRIEGEMLASFRQAGFSGRVGQDEVKLGNDPEEKLQ